MWIADEVDKHIQGCLRILAGGGDADGESATVWAYGEGSSGHVDSG